MFSVIQLSIAAIGCVILQQPFQTCIPYALEPTVPVKVAARAIPKKTGPAIDVALTAQAALVWDLNTDTVLYEKEANTKRPVASLNKLISALAVRELLPNSNAVVVIPPEARKAQLQGANVKLPIGNHVSVRQLLEASLVPSANDAMVSLAVAGSGSESEFVTYANTLAARKGLFDTKLANA
ncbi:MAG: hypothetical protein AAB649_07095, partial [Patescibacteria group bacterium]